MFEDDKHIVQENMIKYGSSFVKSLGEALSHADIINAEKIKNTFPKYWDQYLKMGFKEDEF